MTRETTLRVVAGLSREEMLWRPSPLVNSIGFLIWHVGRVEDFWIQRFIHHQAERWETEDWYHRFGAPLRNTGYGHDPAAVEEIPIPEVDDLLAYLAVVREQTLAYLRELDETKLGDVPRPDRPEMTIGRIILQFMCHENQHTGAIEYLRGLRQGQ